MGGLMFREGNFQASYHFYKRACQLDPATPRGMFANVLYWQRKWDELIDYTESVLSREADNYKFQFRRAEALGEKYVSLDTLLAHVPPGYDTLVSDIDLFGYAAGIAYCARDYESLMSMGKSRLAYDRTAGDSAITYMNLAWAHFPHPHKSSSPNIYADSALACLERFLSGDSVSGLMTLITHTHMAAVYAFRGDSTKADSLCTEVLAKAPVNDQTSLSTILNFCALTYTLIGKQDEAIDILEDLISRPSNVSLFSLKYWELYDPLRDHPRFHALIKKFEKQYEI
jgi:tetratricopeptide (TPR) repeat protein